MDRRTFVTDLGAVLATPLAAGAQQARKRYRIGFLSLASEIEPPDQSDVAAFREGLRVLGYAEGENLVIEQRYAAGRLERLPELAAELVRLKVDVLVTYGSGSSAKQATRSIPIVFIVEPDPVGTGLVASLARPGARDEALEILRQRYARGEIDKQEFDTRRRDLGHCPGRWFKPEPACVIPSP